MRRLLLLLVLAGCGRFGFEDETRDASDAREPSDGSDASVPVVGASITVENANTNSTSFVDVPGATLTVPPSPGVRWLFVVSASLESTTNLYDAPEARYLVDGVEAGLGGTESVMAGMPGPWQHVHLVDGAATPRTITFQLRDAKGGTTQLHDLHAAIVPLPAAAAPLIATADAIAPVATMTYTTVHTLTLTPPSAGDYLLFLLVNATEAPGSSDVEIQWLDPDGVAWGDEHQNPRGAWQSTLLIRRRTLGPGPATIRLQARSGSSGMLQYARVIAIRTEGFGDRLAHGEVLADLSETTSTPQIANDLRPTLGAASQYLVVGSMRVDDNNCGGVIANRGVHFRVDGAPQDSVHRAGNCAYETTYGVVGLLDEPPASVAAGVSSANNVPVGHRESSLLVLGVD